MLSRTEVSKTSNPNLKGGLHYHHPIPLPWFPAQGGLFLSIEKFGIISLTRWSHMWRTMAPKLGKKDLYISTNYLLSQAEIPISRARGAKSSTRSEHQTGMNDGGKISETMRRFVRLGRVWVGRNSSEPTRLGWFTEGKPRTEHQTGIEYDRNISYGMRRFVRLGWVRVGSNLSESCFIPNWDD